MLFFETSKMREPNLVDSWITKLMKYEVSETGDSYACSLSFLLGCERGACSIRRMEATIFRA